MGSEFWSQISIHWKMFSVLLFITISCVSSAPHFNYGSQRNISLLYQLTYLFYFPQFQMDIVILEKIIVLGISGKMICNGNGLNQISTEFSWMDLPRE